MTVVPQPRTSAAQPQPSPRGERRSLALALLLGALGATLALVAAGRTWSEATSAAAQGALPVSAGGRDVTGVPAALAVVGLAALVAVFAVRRAGRVLVAALLTISGAAAAATSLLAGSGTAALQDAAARATGLTNAGVEHVTQTAWPYVSALGGALLLIAGLLALGYGRAWPAMSGRYERPGRSAAGRRRTPPDPDRPEEIWKALDRGEDPTARDA